ncbi:MAG: ABC transporter substrate-binding protein [Gammaproteobacteria bacterium]|nr:ABC transporter substrate-binding protein [Gammaproteobacteria bacterium]
MTPIKISALRHSAFYSPFLMAIAGGFLAKEGLEPHYAPATPDKPLNDGLRDGTWNVGQSAVATSFADLEAGKSLDIIHFARINSRDGFFIASRQADPDFQWAKLKGRKVLVDHFFQPLAMLRYALQKQGISLDELEVIDAGDVGAIEKTFRDGRGEFVHMQGPMPQQLEFEGLAHVVASVGAAVGPVAFSSICATRQWLETDMARAFLHAYTRAREYTVATDSAELARQLQASGFFTDTDSAVLSSTISAYQAMGTWDGNADIGRDEYETLLDVFLASGVISRRHAYESAIMKLPA